MNIQSIYIISGPCGVGKSTTVKGLMQRLENTVAIEGDKIHSLFFDKNDVAWEKRLSITWENIVLLTRNFIKKWNVSCYRLCC